jgi:hypothetical protein
MVEIPLPKGGFTIIDDKDYNKISSFHWYKSVLGYVVCQYKGKLYWMHRLVNNTPEGMITDHINGNKLDNRKCNLRNATCSLNALNSKGNSRNTSGVRGVSWDRLNRNWRAQIWSNYKRIHLGSFKTKEEAENVYKAARKLLMEELCHTKQ